MFFTRRKVTVVLAFVLLFSITSPVLNSTTASAAKKKTYGLIKVQTKFLDKYWTTAHKLCEKSIKNGRGDSDYLLMAQVGLESGHLTSDLAKGKNNCLGIDAYSTGSESVYEHARWFDSIKDCMAYHTDLMVRKYKKASKNYNNPYAFVDSIASTYAPGSGDYTSDIKNLIDKYALYNSQFYTPEIKDIEHTLDRAEKALASAKKRYQKATEKKESLSCHFDLTWAKSGVTPKDIADGSVFSVKAALAQREIGNILENMADWEKRLEKAKKKGRSTFHTIALGINYGRISATKKNLGDAYDCVMEEYEKLS